MSQFQKQTLLDTLSQFLTSSEPLKQVMNTPGLDKKGGKTLTRDGTKAVFVGQNTFKNGPKKGRFGKKGDGNKDGDGTNTSGKGNNGGNKNKKKNSVSHSDIFLIGLYF